MSIQIGKLLPDGSVRHIKALHETLSKDLVRKLRVFYPNDRRVDALLSLGDIQKLGPSPYGKWTGTGDTVHCFSKIRDGRETPRQSASRIADNADIFGRMEDTCLLFDNGRWHVMDKGEYCEQPLFVEDTPSHDSMKPITVYVNNRKYSINSLVYWVTYVHNVVYSFYRSMIYCYINSTQRCAGSIVIDIIPTNGADKRKFFPFAPYFPVTNVIKRYFYPYFPAIIGIKGYSFPYFPYLSGIMKIKTALYSLFSRLDWHKTVVFPCLGEIYEGIRSLSWEIPVT